MSYRFAVLFAVSAAIAPHAALAATPTGGTISPDAPNLSWDGPSTTIPSGASCTGASDAACDRFALTIVPPASGGFQIKVSLDPGPANDWDLTVYGPGGASMATSGNINGQIESITLSNPAAGTYTVAGAPYAALTAYHATAEFVATAGGGGGTNGNEPLSFRIYAPAGLGEPDRHWTRFGPSTGDGGGIGASAGEPTLGVPVKNNLILQATQPNRSNLMYIAGLQTLRLEIDSSVSPPVGTWRNKSAPTHVQTLDPILEVNQKTGRTLSTQLNAKRSLISLSDDNGETWTESPQGGGINSGVDHQTIGTGPFSPSDPVGSLLYPEAVYYASQDIAAAEASISHDGGVTWGAAVPMYNILNCGGLHGHLQVTPDTAPDDRKGTVFVPNKNCGGEAGFARSTDGGVAWQTIVVPGVGGSGSDPAMGVAADGTVYFGQCGGNNANVVVSVSTDNGGTWTTPADIGAPLGLKNCVFPTMVAGDAQRAAFAFLGSTTAGAEGTGEDPTAFPGVWYLYVAATYDGGATWTTVNVTPDDPVQRGAVCLSGTTCAGGRNLLDFIDIQKDEKGRIYVAYADGCTGTCVSGGANSGSDVARIARQQPGSRSLYGAYDGDFAPAQPVAPLQPYLEAFLSGSQSVPRASIRWAQPWDGRQAITQYKLFRRADPGSYGAAPLATLGAAALSYVDTSVQAGVSYCYKVQAVNGAGTSPAVYEACAVAEPVVDPCAIPGALRADDSGGDQTGAPANAQLDLKRLFVGEPFIGDPAACATPSERKLVFDLELGDTAVTSPGNTWIVLWNRAHPQPDATGTQTYDRQMINARATATGVECHVGKVTAPSVNQGVDTATLAAADCQLKGDGHLIIQVPLNLIDDCLGANCGVDVGYSLQGVEIRNFSANLSGQPISSTAAQDTSPALSYTLIGNDACRPNPLPTAAGDDLFANLAQASANLDVLGNDEANGCGTLRITDVSTPISGTAAIAADGLSIVYAPTGQVCDDRFTYTIEDGTHGNTAFAVVVVHHDRRTTAGVDEYLFADGFDGGFTCPAPVTP
ncbi:MAG TPA: Ig-like domain-containing protein [Tahibacter sp.]|uniref:Ig-like domain-containing protein n=1 Tax=Tahibacter sp. TaxID=2056211 RepID=UPI002C3265AA|nr:Ig-like domain-containing protein [Tahibacter sp.]HSX60672.1 Ig-like domain-containing protein [Tahibacter sp.]